jgi:meiotic recombination protein DMC1
MLLSCWRAAACPPQKLYAVKGLSESKADKMVEAARKLTKTGGWQSASDTLQERQRSVLKISTGCTAVNELMGGGIETKAITELYGEHRQVAGKLAGDAAAATCCSLLCASFPHGSNSMLAAAVMYLV